MKGECVIPLTPRPRRAEQVPSALADGCDPAAGCKAPDIRVLLCDFTVASRKRVPAPRSGAPLPQ